jgi:hypothetical protein
MNIHPFPLSLDIKSNYLFKKLKIDENGNILRAYKHFDDYDINNYIICYVYVNEYKNFEFDENLYNEYHKEYLKYYSRNSNTKILVITNGKYGYKWCKSFMKFINVYYYYIKSDNDINIYL